LKHILILENVLATARMCNEGIIGPLIIAPMVIGYGINLDANKAVIFNQESM
jgi:hypothetical protein